MDKRPSRQQQIKILYEDKWLYVVEKPSCQHSVGEESLGELLTEKYGEIGDQKFEGGLVNRLDYETSGVMLGGKTPEAFKKLRKMVQSGEIDKTYLALIAGELKKEIKVEGWIGPRHRGSKKVTLWKNKPTGKGIRALFGESIFTPIKYFKSGKKTATLVSVKASVARRHQIRVSAASIDMPLIGDSLYGQEDSVSDYSRDLVEEQTLYLHAAELSFKHPYTEVVLEIKTA